jgi:hypothetical protein
MGIERCAPRALPCSGMTTYTIKEDGKGGFAVLVSNSPEKGSYIAIALPARERAERRVAVREQRDRDMPSQAIPDDN